MSGTVSDRLLLDQVSEVLLAVDPATLLIQGPISALALLGFEPQSLVGRSITDGMRPSDISTGRKSGRGKR